MGMAKFQKILLRKSQQPTICKVTLSLLGDRGMGLVTETFLIACLRPNLQIQYENSHNEDYQPHWALTPLPTLRQGPSMPNPSPYYVQEAVRGIDCMLPSILPLWTKPAPTPWHLSKGDSANPKGRTCDLAWPITVFQSLHATVIGLGLES